VSYILVIVYSYVEVKGNQRKRDWPCRNGKRKSLTDVSVAMRVWPVEENPRPSEAWTGHPLELVGTGVSGFESRVPPFPQRTWKG
jgi:hypothetical protein